MRCASASSVGALNSFGGPRVWLKRNSGHCLSTERRVAGASCEEEMTEVIPSSRAHSSGFTAGPLTQPVEVLQQGIEAGGSGARVQIDAADLLDQLLQRLQLLQTQQ